MPYRQIKRDDIKPGSEYARLMSNVLKKSTNALPIKEPISPSLAKQIGEVIQQDQYLKLPFWLQDFNRALFQALRLQYISQNQFLTAKYCYDALGAFNTGKINEKSATQISEHPLGEGPFLLQSITGNNNKKHKSLIDKIDKKKHRYFVASLPHRFYVGYLYYGLEKFSAHNHPFFKEELKLYFLKSHNPKKMIKDDIKHILCRYTHFMTERDIDTLRQYIHSFESEEDCILTDEKNINHHLDPDEFHKSYGDIIFLLNLIRPHRSVPSLVYLDRHDQKASALGFVILTPDSTCFLLQSYYGDNAVLPHPIVGRFRPHLVRKMLENVDDKTDLKLEQSIYNDSNQHFRPTEIVHDDVQSSLTPHGYRCHHFFLTWHDILHAWIVSTFPYKLLAKLRAFHTRKLGFTRSGIHHQMTKSIWALTDLDLQFGHVLNEANIHLGAAEDSEKNWAVPYSFLWLLSKANILNFESQDETNELFFWEVTTNEEYWRQWLFQLDFLSYLEKWWQHDYFDDIQIFFMMNQLKFFKRNKQAYPSDNIIHLIIRRMCSSLSTQALKLLMNVFYLCDVKDVVYWSKNNGLYFHPSLKSSLPKQTAQKISCNHPNKIMHAIITVVYKLSDMKVKIKIRQIFNDHLQYMAFFPDSETYTAHHWVYKRDTKVTRMTASTPKNDVSGRSDVDSKFDITQSRSIPSSLRIS